MKWKLSSRFVFTISSVAVIVTIINIMTIVIIMFCTNMQANSSPDNQTMSSAAEIDTESFTRNFNTYIVASNDDVYISDEGKKVLDSKKVWIQILDEDGSEVYNYRKADNTPSKYTPFQIVHGYKYSGAIGETSTILVGEKIVENKQYSYLIGFPVEKIRKVFFLYNTEEARIVFKNSSLIVLITNSMIALFLGYLFSRRLTKPLDKIITGVGELENGDYEMYYPSEGIYKDVFYKLNSLSQTLKNNKKERLTLDKMRDEWISNITHEIKTPLATIKGYAEILNDYEFTWEDVKAYAEIINRKSNYIKDLIGDLNLTARLKNNDSILNKRESNIVKLVKEAVIDILNNPEYCDRDINFISEEKVILKAVDDILIKRLIHNLIDNALIHNNAEVKIDVKVIKDKKVHIFVKDSGKGIRIQEIENVFDRYYRGTNTGEIHKGSGLGMAIAKEIVIAHGGDIKISSILGEGTEIQIIL